MQEATLGAIINHIHKSCSEYDRARERADMYKRGIEDHIEVSQEFLKLVFEDGFEALQSLPVDDKKRKIRKQLSHRLENAKAVMSLQLSK